MQEVKPPIEAPGILLTNSPYGACFNGVLECWLFRFDMVAGFNRREAANPKDVAESS